MKFITTARFERAYKACPAEVKLKIKDCLQNLSRDWRYSSLHTKKIKGTSDIREARVSLDYRLTFQISEGVLLLRNAGHHNPTSQNP